jgi:thiamine-phosphate pyrophosphorylase
MNAPYETPTAVQSRQLAQIAPHFSGSRLNPLVLTSDPKRTPDILALAANMPGQSALIYRHFGEPGLENELRRITRARDVQFLIGDDPELAEACGADGVHFTRRTPGSSLSAWRAKQPDWIISAAAYKEQLDPRPLALLDALFLSPVFQSASPSAGPPMGLTALKHLTDYYDCPVFGLGGINQDNAASLIGSGIAGIGAVGGLAQELRMHMTASPTPANQPNGAVTISKQESGDQITFTARVGGAAETGELTLRRVSNDVWDANHTGVPKSIGGRGVGKALIQAMVEDARQSGYRVVPSCPFVAKLFERKPEWANDAAA